MEILKVYQIVIFSLSLINGIEGTKFGIRFNKTITAKNGTKSYGEYIAYSYRTKRQVLEPGYVYPILFEKFFFYRHIRRGTCVRGVLTNDGEEWTDTNGNPIKNRFNDELDYTASWAEFTKSGGYYGNRRKNSFVIHEKFNYTEISEKLKSAIISNIHKMYRPWYPHENNEWFVDLPANDLGDLNVAFLWNITWRRVDTSWYLHNYAKCRCGRVEITLGFKIFLNNDIQITHFDRQKDLVEGNSINCI